MKLQGGFVGRESSISQNLEIVRQTQSHPQNLYCDIEYFEIAILLPLPQRKKMWEKNLHGPDHK